MLQAIVLASQDNVFQPFVKRITGTGTINITVDGGTFLFYFTLNSEIYTQVQVTKTAANPSIGFQIVTNGDAIAVDMADMQGGAFASSPIPTTTVAVTRNAGVLTYPAPGNVNAVTSTIYMEMAPNTVTDSVTAQVPLQTDNGSNTDRILFAITLSSAVPYYQVIAVSAVQATINFSNSAVGAMAKYAGSAQVANFNAAKGGTLGTPVLSGAMPAAATTIRFGDDSASNGIFYGTIRNVKIYSTALSAATLQAMTTP